MSPPAVSGVVAEQRPHLSLLRLGQRLEHRSRRSWSSSMIRSAASSGAIRASSRAASASERGADELQLVLRVELLEDVRLEFPVGLDRLDDLLALLVRCGLDEVRDLGRVQPGELPVRDPERAVGTCDDERLDALPVDSVPRLDPLARPARGTSA